MVETSKTKKGQKQKPLTGISRITVCGFKSIAEEQSIEIRPLTVLAGANSSGKSSIMQPLLLMKQTLEAGYDPGTLLLNGPILKFTSWDQLLARTAACDGACELGIGIEVNSTNTLTTCFGRTGKGTVEVREMSYVIPNEHFTLRQGMTRDEILKEYQPVSSPNNPWVTPEWVASMDWIIVPRLCFLDIRTVPLNAERPGDLASPLPFSTSVEHYLKRIVYLPGLRGNPARDYPVASAEPPYSGTFEPYTASVIAKWQEQQDTDKLKSLRGHLEMLGLTWTVSAKRLDDTRVELQVGRLPRRKYGSEEDVVSIADVGVGVSQILPVLVALLVAEPGQMVYLEQPEIHLHPRAQFLLARVLSDAAKRGVRVVAETHSALLLLGVQTLVAEGKLDPTLVKLHWFKRRKDGTTKIDSAELDESGAFGDWPEDFAGVELEAQSRYLDAAGQRLRSA